MKNNDPEHQIQCAFAEYLDLKGYLWFATQTGLKTSKNMAKRAKKAGMKKGVPDIFIMEPRQNWHGLIIELKSPSGSSTPEQRTWIFELDRRLYKAVIVKEKTIPATLDRLIKIVKHYMGEIK